MHFGQFDVGFPFLCDPPPPTPTLREIIRQQQQERNKKEVNSPPISPLSKSTNTRIPFSRAPGTSSSFKYFSANANTEIEPERGRGKRGSARGVGGAPFTHPEKIP